MPKTNIGLSVFVVANLLGATLQLAEIAPMTISFANTLSATLARIAVMGFAIIATIRRLSGSQYFLIAWAFSLAGYLAVALFANGALHFSYFLYYFVGVGILIELALLSFALAGRIQTLNQERDAEVTVTTRIGVAPVHTDDKGLETVLERADGALYEAKNQGRNRIVSADAPHVV